MPKVKSLGQQQADERKDIETIRAFLLACSKIEKVDDLVPLLRDGAAFALERFDADMKERGL